MCGVLTRFRRTRSNSASSSDDSGLGFSVTAKPLPPSPFQIPLADDDLILMGKVAVMWGQIDEGFNSMLRWVLKLDPKV